jgi:peptidoglycan/LPS O-acetylase OafA/YrhL
MLQLDALRAFAVLAVLLQHTITMPAPLNFGRAGVRLFYVLSGFLITRILLQARARSVGKNDAFHALRAFYSRRVLRIFPLYYLVLAAAFMLAVPRFGEYCWSLVTYTSNLQVAATGNFQEQPFGHFWSLAVEEQFYVLWPVLMLFLPRRWLLPTIVATILIGPLSRLLLLHIGRGVAYEVMTTSCLDTLGAGALLAFLREDGNLPPSAMRRIGNWWLGAGIVILALIALPALALRAYTPAKVLLDTAYLSIFAWLVARAADGFSGWIKRLLELKPLVYLGTISYGVYVYHYFVPVVSEGLSPSHNGMNLFLYVTLVTIAVATVSWFLFEKPLNDLKRYLPYHRPKRIVVTIRAPRREWSTTPKEEVSRAVSVPSD